MNKKKVLVVEDDEVFYRIWSRQLQGKILLICAVSLEEAEEKFSTNPDIVAIVMDGCVIGEGEWPNTVPLVRKFRANFTGPMIASSSLEGHRQDLMKAGCDYESPKMGLAQKLLEVLGLNLNK